MDRVGVRNLIAKLSARPVRAAGCILGEPTSMRPVIAHKSGLAYRCCVPGREALVTEITNYAAQLRKTMRGAVSESEIRIEKIGEAPMINTTENAPLAKRVRALSSGLSFGHVIVGSEAGLFQPSGIPSVNCGQGAFDPGMYR